MCPADQIFLKTALVETQIFRQKCRITSTYYIWLESLKKVLNFSKRINFIAQLHKKQLLVKDGPKIEDFHEHQAISKKLTPEILKIGKKWRSSNLSKTYLYGNLCYFAVKSKKNESSILLQKIFIAFFRFLENCRPKTCKNIPNFTLFLVGFIFSPYF